ncbi:MAG: hypothetical protein PHX44_04810 [Sulfurimonas sp.]|uniref:hypothetical protein n=1 Tax=Sulfurimonas sp. TaxID=2022749 RepID=UPI002605AF8A|nr:hypothetical protein [Sulfurimonas sp.]MDD2652355.1 hypothetical protein [Sulfurimonas sp.]MDD3451169.1 hypothetical protein [Sulfurimonas sp.]
MKTVFILLLTLFLSHALLATELDWVDEQIAAIKPPRKGVVVSGVDNPFVFLNKNKPKDAKKDGAASVASGAPTVQKAATDAKKEKKELTSADFSLNTIINASAMINGNWYKQNDIVSEYTISEIDRQFVILKNKKGDKTIFLSTATKKPTLKFKNK